MTDEELREIELKNAELIGICKGVEGEEGSKEVIEAILICTKYIGVLATEVRLGRRKITQLQLDRHMEENHGIVQVQTEPSLPEDRNDSNSDGTA